MPNCAPRAATIRSQARTISNPPASANPSTAAISGLREDRRAIPAKPRSSSHGAGASGGERFEVHPRAETFTGAGEYADRNRGVAIELLERLRDRLGGFQVDRVARLGPVERDHQNAVTALAEHGSGHCRIL